MRLPAQVRELAKETAAFATSGGGLILIGVDDSGGLAAVADLDDLTEVGFIRRVLSSLRNMAGAEFYHGRSTSGKPRHRRHVTARAPSAPLLRSRLRSALTVFNEESRQRLDESPDFVSDTTVGSQSFLLRLRIGG